MPWYNHDVSHLERQRPAYLFLTNKGSDRPVLVAVDAIDCVSPIADGDTEIQGAKVLLRCGQTIVVEESLDDILEALKGGAS